MTYREIIYSILDLFKESSDDSYYSEEYVVFLALKMRAAILKLTYTNIKKEIPQSNYQTICLDLELTPAISGEPCEGGVYLKSRLKIPDILTVGSTRVHPIDFYSGDITFVTRERMKYVGHNKWLLNIIYASIGPDSYLYFKSSNPLFLYLNKVLMTGIFEDAQAASELSCDSSDSCDDLYDKTFPLEEGLVSSVIEMTYKFLSSAIYKPEDNENNANDDLSTLVSFLRLNLKSPLQQQIENG